MIPGAAGLTTTCLHLAEVALPDQPVCFDSAVLVARVSRFQVG